MTRYCPLCDRRMASDECPTHALPTVDLSAITKPLEPVESGSILAGRYQVEAEVGEGASGTVFLATRPGMRNRIALKVLRRETMLSLGMLHRFYMEARTVSTLDHPNIVRIVDFGLDPRTALPFLAMEFLEGATLKELVRRDGPMSERRAAGLLAQVAKALVEAHQKSIVHRDLKPANIMVSVLADGDEHAKVLDFGIAKLLDDPEQKNRLRITAPGTMLGSPHYMSPEQVDGDEVDFRTDLYSLGCILFEIVTGKPPFLADQIAQIMHKQVSEPPPSLPHQLEDGDPPSLDLTALYEALLAKDRNDRPSSTALVAWILGALSRGETIGAESLLGHSKTSLEGRGTEITDPPVAPREPIAAARGSGSPLAVSRDPLAEHESAPRSSTNLRQEIRTFFVGRETDISELDRLFRGGARLVTLTGTPGIGKTELARRYGAIRADAFGGQGGGCWFFDLSEAFDRGGILRTIASVLDRARPGALRALERDLRSEDAVLTLGDLLRMCGRVLVVLDGFEARESQAVQTLGRWLDIAKDASFLVTSREPLAIAGEHHRTLAPLEEADGRALFEARARAVRPAFSISQVARSSISHIVRRLDHVPLAIELAASRLEGSSLSALAEQISRTFPLPAAGPRSEGHRRRLMRQVIEWSLASLEPWEDAALTQATVFSGGFSLEAAEEVLDLSMHAGAPPIPDVLFTLRKRALLVAGESPGWPGELRLNLHDAVRALAWRRLDQAEPERQALEKRHRTFFLREAEAWASRSRGSSSQRFVRLLHRETENLIAAFLAAETTEPDVASRILLALEPLFSVRDTMPREVARALLESAFSSSQRARDPSLAERAKALLARLDAPATPSAEVKPRAR